MRDTNISIARNGTIARKKRYYYVEQHLVTMRVKSHAGILGQKL